MKNSLKLTGILTGALAFTSLFGMSASADSRHQDGASLRAPHYVVNQIDRREDRDVLRGRVERVDRRRGTVLLRASNGRSVLVRMTAGSDRRGADLEDLRRGHYVTFVGDWSRRGFVAWRIDDIDSGRRR